MNDAACVGGSSPTATLTACDPHLRRRNAISLIRINSSAGRLLPRTFSSPLNSPSYCTYSTLLCHPSPPLFLPLQLSFSHALLYGEDKPAGYGRFTREYFVRDLGSTNGTLVNK